MRLGKSLTLGRQDLFYGEGDRKRMERYLQSVNINDYTVTIVNGISGNQELPRNF